MALESGACMSIHPSRSCVHNRSRKAAPDAPKHEAGAHGQVERAGVFQVREWEGRGGGGGRRLKGAWTLAVSGGVGCRWDAGCREGDGREDRWHVCRMLAWQWQGAWVLLGWGGKGWVRQGLYFVRSSHGAVWTMETTQRGLPTRQEAYTVLLGMCTIDMAPLVSDYCLAHTFYARCHAQETLHVGEARCQALVRDRPKRELWLWCALREWIERPPECIGWREPRRSTR